MEQNPALARLPRQAIDTRDYRSTVRKFPGDGTDGEQEDAPVVRIIEERPPLREGKIFVDFEERATIAESLATAYMGSEEDRNRKPV